MQTQLLNADLEILFSLPEKNAVKRFDMCTVVITDNNI